MSNSRCKYCQSSKIKKNGFTKCHARRWRCLKCGKSWTIKRTRKSKQDIYSKMFVSWVKKGDSIKRISSEYKYSYRHTIRILHNMLDKPVPFSKRELSNAKYILFDGKYIFGRRYSIVTIIDANTNRPVISHIVKSENKKCVLPWLVSLKTSGFNPIAVTLDGRADIIRCFKDVWPDIKTQRCLFHIRMQVEMWSRRPPRTALGKTLSIFLRDLINIKYDEVEGFKEGYDDILRCHSHEIKMNKQHKEPGASRDLNKAISLLNNALPDMFYHTEDENISATTSALEGLHKEIERAIHFNHCGLTEDHCFKFLMWFIHSRK